MKRHKVTATIPSLDVQMMLESTIDDLQREKENLMRTLEEGSEMINQAKEIVEWLLSHNKNYTKEQYYKLQDLEAILKGE